MEEQIPDWEWHCVDFTDTDRSYLTRLDNLRRYSPILWALVRGTRTSRGIAGLLPCPHNIVLYELRRYKKAGLTYDEESDKGMVWRLNHDDLFDLRDFVLEIKRRNREQERNDREREG